VLVTSSATYSGATLAAGYQNVAQGTLGFATLNSTVNQADGSALVTVNRLGGDSGAVGVTVATSDGTAVAGIDYTATTQTLMWADGDVAPKYVTIPVSTTATEGSGKSLNLNLSNPTGGAALGPVAGSLEIVGGITVLQNNVTLNVSGIANQPVVYSFQTNVGAQNLTVTLNSEYGGSFYSRFANIPVIAAGQYDCSSGITYGTCSYSENPEAAGDYFITVVPAANETYSVNVNFVP
jgi:hypothetical protein